MFKIFPPYMHTIFCAIVVCVNPTFIMWDVPRCFFGWHFKEFLKNTHCITHYLFWNSMIDHLFQRCEKKCLKSSFYMGKFYKYLKETKFLRSLQDWFNWLNMFCKFYHRNGITNRNIKILRSICRRKYVTFRYKLNIEPPWTFILLDFQTPSIRGINFVFWLFPINYKLQV